MSCKQRHSNNRVLYKTSTFEMCFPQISLNQKWLNVIYDKPFHEGQAMNSLADCCMQILKIIAINFKSEPPGHRLSCINSSRTRADPSGRNF